MSFSRKPRPTFAVEYDLWTAGHRAIAGADEVGVGAVAGPLVAAAVILPLPEESADVGEFLRTLAEAWWEVRDSKDIADNKKVRLDALIRKSAAVGIGMVDVAESDVLANQDNATRVATERALDALPRLVEAVLIDGGVQLPKRDLIYRRVMKENGATTSLMISAASIVANMHFNKIMCDYGERYPDYGFAQHKGYLTPQHQKAILHHGTCPIHRPPNKDVLKILAQRRVNVPD